MGGGNGQKSQTKRLRNMVKAQKDAKSKGSAKPGFNAALFIKCTKCMQVFNNTVSKVELQAHCESKHSDHGFDASFPDYEKFRASLAEMKAPKPKADKK